MRRRTLCALAPGLIAACSRSGEGRAPAAPVERSEAESAPTLPTRPLPASMQRGICLAHSWEGRGAHGYGTPTSAATLAELKELGATWVSLTPFGFAPNLRSNEVRHVGERGGGESDARVRREIRAARALGLEVLLKPHIWVSGGAWRAELAPSDWSGWFASYEAWIVRYARLAAEEGVATLAVGTELRSSVAHEPAWRAVLEAVRAVYDKTLVYCANWDAVQRVPFWDGLDHIGVQFYPPLADHVGASTASMGARLRDHLDQLEGFARRTGRSVLFTEVGYKSTEDTAIRPYEWTERGSSRVDQRAQANAYRVLFEGIMGRPWLEGVYLWKWFTNPRTREEGPRGFSPRGKASEAIIRAAFTAPPD